MTSPPADWYDDPEDPSQYRYWDGTTWTEHRAPRTSAASSDSASASADRLIVDSWQVVTREWRQLMLAALVVLAVAVAVLGVVFAAVNSVVSPGLTDIFDRLTDSAFDPANNPADDAFLESIRFDPTAATWLTIGVVPLLGALAMLVVYGAMALHLAGAQVSTGRGMRACIRLALGRVARWIGITVLWSLCLFGAFIPLLILLVAIDGSGAAIVLVTFVAIPAYIYAFPFIWILPTSLLVGPVDRPPLRQTIKLIKGRWKMAAWPIFLVNLIYSGTQIASGVLNSIGLIGSVLGMVVTAIAYVFSLSSGIRIYRHLGGEIATDIPAEQA